MERVKDIVQRPIWETAPFRLDLTEEEQEGSAYADLVIARNLAHQASVLEGHALQVSDLKLKLVIVHGTLTFEALEQETFELPIVRDGEGPFTRCLSFQVQKSFEMAVRKEWVPKTEPRPDGYGSIGQEYNYFCDGESPKM